MQAKPISAGEVVSLWRYPVKSMGGEEINSTAITERGILGDRTYAVMDRATGHIASAKYPRKWSALLACRAAFVEPPRLGAPLPPVSITLPDGTVISSSQSDVDQVLSRTLGHEVTLLAEAPAELIRESDRTPIDAPPGQEIIRQEPMATASPGGTFFDYAPIHILTTATLQRLQELYPEGRFVERRFRPNIVVKPSGDEHGFVENAWIGHSLTLGEAVHLDIIDPSPRCVITTLAQGDLPRDIGILRTVSQHNAATSATAAPGVVFPAVAGVYARLLREGMICHGDAIRVE